MRAPNKKPGHNEYTDNNRGHLHPHHQPRPTFCKKKKKKKGTNVSTNPTTILRQATTLPRQNNRHALTAFSCLWNKKRRIYQRPDEKKKKIKPEEEKGSVETLALTGNTAVNRRLKKIFMCISLFYPPPPNPIGTMTATSNKSADCSATKKYERKYTNSIVTIDSPCFKACVCLLAAS